jgi:hypothetical protein
MERKHPKTMRGWSVFWPQRNPNLLKNISTVQGSVGTNPKLIRNQAPAVETGAQDDQLRNTPQAVKAKQGNTQWIQQWLNYPSSELIVGMTGGEDPGKDGPPIRPKEETNSPAEEEELDPESEERMMEFATGDSPNPSRWVTRRWKQRSTIFTSTHPL